MADRRTPVPPPVASTRLDTVLQAERDALRVMFPLPPQRAPRTRRRNAVAGSALALLLAAGLWTWDPAYQREHFATAPGERAEVALADGSRLTLDTATTLDVAWHLRTRRVTLQAGQARFAAAKAVVRPFDVAAGSVRVRVLGTVFDVRREPDGARVTVLEGRVRVWPAPNDTAPLPLVAGQQLRVQHGAAQPIQAVDTMAASAWERGQLVFARTPLAEVLAEMQRYHPAPLRLQDDARHPIGRLAVSGVFDSAQTDRLLALLPRILPVTVQRQADGSADIAPAR